MISLTPLSQPGLTDLSTDGLTADASLQGQGLPAEFLTLLGDRLLTLATQQGVLANAPAETPLAVENAATEKHPLQTLLATLDKPETLQALLTHENAKAPVKSADDKDKEQSVALSDEDKQALQALFAMLPATQTMTPLAPQTGIGNTLPRDTLTSSKTETPALSLTATAAQPEARSAQTLPMTAGTPTVAHAAPGTPALSSLTPAPDQRLGVHDEELTGQATQQNGSHNAALATLSSASSVQTPASHALVQAPGTPQLNAQLGSQEWQQGLSQHILLFNRQGHQSAELKLNPQDLGAIQISLKLDNDQASLNLISGHSQVRAALEAALPHLRSALADNGIQLGQSSVSSDSPSSNSAFAGQQEQRETAQGRQFLTQQSGENEQPLAVPTSLQARVSGHGGVDIFA